MPTQLRDSQGFWGKKEQKKNTKWEQKQLEAYFKEREQQNRRNTSYTGTQGQFWGEQGKIPPIPLEALTIVYLPGILWNKGKMAIYSKGTKEQKKNATGNMGTKADSSIF